VPWAGVCNIAGWAEGTGSIWPREEKDKGRSNCCPHPSKGGLQRREGQTPLKDARRKDKRQRSQDAAREVLTVGRKFFTRRFSRTNTGTDLCETLQSLCPRRHWKFERQLGLPWS